MVSVPVNIYQDSRAEIVWLKETFWGRPVSCSWSYVEYPKISIKVWMVTGPKEDLPAISRGQILYIHDITERDVDIYDSETSTEDIDTFSSVLFRSKSRDSWHNPGYLSSVLLFDRIMFTLTISSGN